MTTYDTGLDRPGDRVDLSQLSIPRNRSPLPPAERALTFEINPECKYFVSCVDTERALEPWIKVIGEARGKSPGEILTALKPLYDQFVEKIMRQINDCGFKVILLPSRDLEETLRVNTNGLFTVSLNAGDSRCDFQLELSRRFDSVGKELLGMTARPGAPAIAEQLNALSVQLERRGMPSVCLVDDHAFSCRTLESAVEALESIGIEVSQIAVLSQVGDSAVLARRGIPIIPACRFVGPEGASVLDCVELVEARYFLLGSAGCVVDLGGGVKGRAPYLLPFADPTNRASIPSERAVAFSITALRYNAEFFAAIEREFGMSLTAADGRADAATVLERYGIEAAQPLQEAAESVAERLEAGLREGGPWSNASPRRAEELGQALRAANLPQRCLFLDVNGTLIERGQSGIAAWAGELLKSEIQQLQGQGVAVGLCSDSPGMPLQRLAQQLGMRGPILAENGNLLLIDRDSVVLNPLPNRLELETQIRSIARANGFTEEPQMEAVDFGGSPPDLRGRFAFGRGRQTSVACFGDPGFIARLELVSREQGWAQTFGVSLDCNPNWRPYGVAIAHPGSAVVAGKGMALDLLTRYGIERSWIIGDGAADCIEGNSKVRSFLVGQLGSPLGARAARATPQAGLAAVIELMNEVSKEA